MTPVEIDGRVISIFSARMICVSVGKGAEECVCQQAGNLLLRHRYGMLAVVP